MWNALLRVEPDKDPGLIGAISVAALFACVIAGVRWAGDIGGTGVPFPTAASALYGGLAGALEAIYFVTLTRALERGRLGPVYTVSRGGAVLVIWPASILLLAETVTWTSSTGSVLVLLGLILAGVGAGLAVGDGGPRGSSGIAWAVACAVSIAGYHLAYKAALAAGGRPSATFGASLALAAALRIALLSRAGRAKLWNVVRARTGRVVLMGIVCGGSFLILMEALRLGGSGYVLTLRNVSVLFAAGMAVAIGERPHRVEVIGAALVAVGAVVMAL